MTLSERELKKLAIEFVKEDSPELADEVPSVQEEVRTVSPASERKLGLAHPRAIPSKVTVFTFKKTVTAEDGAKIPIVTRVSLDENGNVIKSTGN